MAKTIELPGEAQKDGFPAAATAGQAKASGAGRKVLVGAGFSVDDMLNLDADGVDLVFEQKEKFLPLDDKTVGMLTGLNRTRYSMAKEFHDAWRGDEHAEFVEKFKVDRQMVGSATSKLTANPVSKGLFSRWTRPDRVEELRGKGYKILAADEAKSYLGPVGGHHEIGKLGQTELVLMGIDNGLHDKMLAERTRKNNEMAGAYKGSALAEMNQAGGAPFEATDDVRDRVRWQQLPSGED